MVDVHGLCRKACGNSSPRSQYRLRFATLDSDGDSINDYVQIEDAENTRASGNVPQLVVTYTLP